MAMCVRIVLLIALLSIVTATVAYKAKSKKILINPIPKKDKYGVRNYKMNIYAPKGTLRYAPKGYTKKVLGYKIITKSHGLYQKGKKRYGYVMPYTKTHGILPKKKYVIMPKGKSLYIPKGKFYPKKKHSYLPRGKYPYKQKRKQKIVEGKYVPKKHFVYKPKEFIHTEHKHKHKPIGVLHDNRINSGIARGRSQSVSRILQNQFQGLAPSSMGQFPDVNIAGAGLNNFGINTGGIGEAGLTREALAIRGDLNSLHGPVGAGESLMGNGWETGETLPGGGVMFERPEIP